MADLNSIESRRARVMKGNSKVSAEDEGKEMDAIRRDVPIFRQKKEDKDENAARLREAAAKYGISADSSGVGGEDKRHEVEREILREILGYDPAPSSKKTFRAGKGVSSSSSSGSSGGNGSRRKIKPPKLSNPFRSAMGKRHSSSPIPASSSYSSSNSSYSSDSASSSGTGANSAQRNDLITSMAARLTQLEKSAKQMRADLVRKEKEALELRRENQALKEASGGAEKAAEAIKATQEQNRALKRQIHEMESFLADYGLIWVGDGGGSSKSSLNRDGGKASKETLAQQEPMLPPHWLDFSLLFARIRGLNAVASEQKPKIVKNELGHHEFKRQNPVLLTIFKDGIIVDIDGHAKGVKAGNTKAAAARGASFAAFRFRPYSDEATEMFMRDLLDGYFPNEFKKRFPDGVEIKVSDQSDQIFSATAQDQGPGKQKGDTEQGNGHFFAPFSGKGNVLHDQDGAEAEVRLSKMGPSELNLIGGESSHGQRRASGDEATRALLRKLPEKVVRNSCVVSVRSALTKRFLGGDKDKGSVNESGRREQIELVSTGVLRSMQGVAEEEQEGEEQEEEGREGQYAQNAMATNQDQVTSIRVKLNGRGENGNVLLLKMLFDDSLGALRKYINRHLMERTGNKLCDHEYELRTAFPSRVLKDSNDTLRELDLVPNGNVILRFTD